VNIPYSCPDIDRALGSLEQIESEASTAQDAIDAIFERINEARNHFEGARKINAQLREALQEAHQEIADLKRELAEKEREIARLEDEVEDARSEIVQLRAELANAEAYA